MLEGAAHAYKKPLDEPRSGPDSVRDAALVQLRLDMYARHGLEVVRAPLEIDFELAQLAM